MENLCILADFDWFRPLLTGNFPDPRPPVIQVFPSLSTADPCIRCGPIWTFRETLTKPVPAHACMLPQDSFKD